MKRPSFASPIRKYVVYCTATYAVTFLALILLGLGTKPSWRLCFGLFEVLPPLFAGLCAVAYARRGSHKSRPHRVGWFNIGLGCLSFAAGDMLVALSGGVRGVESFLPGWWNIGYLAAYPFLIGGVILLFGSIHIAERARLLVDSAIAASSAGILSWYCLIERLWRQSDAKLIGKIIHVAYPLGDIAALFGAIVLVVAASRSQQMRRSALLLSGGLVLLTLGDSFFTYYGLNENYQAGSWIDWEWSVGWILIGYACLLPLWWPRPETQPLEARPVSQSGAIRSLFSVLTPYAAVAASILVVAMDDYHKSYVISVPVFALEASLITLIIVRQILTIIENQRLAALMQRFNADLECVVAQRTRQLSSLHALTTAVNSTLRIDQVLDSALKHTLAAMRSDAVSLTLFEPGQETNNDCPPAGSHIGFDGCPEALAFVHSLPPCGEFRLLSFKPDTGVRVMPVAWVLQAPLLWQMQAVGMITVVRWGYEFEDTEPDMIRSIGVEVGTAVENARSYSAALDVADRCPVTALYNHRAIHQRLDAELSQSKRLCRPMAVIMIDVNNFKQFNDTYGHPAGDQVLKRVAAVLNEQCRVYDILGRYGGDEFLAVLPACDAVAADVVAHRLRDAIASQEFTRTGEQHSVPVTLSFGIAAYPDDGANRHELVSRADVNLYSAKHSEEGVVRSTPSQHVNRLLKIDGSFDMLDAMVTAVDNKDRYTRRHSEDVTEYALWTAEEIGLSEETMRVIRAAGLLHDVGKIGVPAEILGKPDRLTPEEFDIIKRHPELGAMIIAGMPDMEGIIPGVRSHHERWDGNGYPDGLAGEEIPFLGRLLAVADAVSAMTTHRPYRKAMEWGAAIEQIQAHTGSQFDPEIASAFLRAAKKQMALPCLQTSFTEPSSLQLESQTPGLQQRRASEAVLARDGCGFVRD